MTKLSKYVLSLGIVVLSVIGCSATPNATGNLAAPGSLSITLGASDLYYSGESTLVTVTLSNGESVSNLTVNFTLNNNNIINLNESSCVIASSLAGQNSCSVVVTALDTVGSVNIIASANGYISQISALNVSGNSLVSYISDNQSNSLYKCSVDFYGHFTSCQAESVFSNSVSNITGITLNQPVIKTSSSGNNNLYVPLVNGLSICAIGLGGELTSCAVESLVDGMSNSINPNSIAFVGESTLIVTQKSNGKAYTCNSNESMITNCSEVPTQTFTNVNYVYSATLESSDFLYFLKPYVTPISSVIKCDYDNSTFDCSSALPLLEPGLFANPTSIDIRKVGPINLAYITDLGGDVIKVCNVGESSTNLGELSICTTTPRESAPSWRPVSITLNQSPDSLYSAYVSDANGALYNCAATVLTLDGLSRCQKESGGITAWSPNGVAFFRTIEYTKIK